MIIEKKLTAKQKEEQEGQQSDDVDKESLGLSEINKKIDGTINTLMDNFIIRYDNRIY